MLLHQKGRAVRDEEVTEWVRGTVRALMVKRRMTYADLTVRLNAMGLNENERALRNKVARATYSASFFVQLLLAIGIVDLHLDVQKVMGEPDAEREFASQIPTKPTPAEEKRLDVLQASMKQLRAELRAELGLPENESLFREHDEEFRGDDD